jgi:SnoaL-like domain
MTADEREQRSAIRDLLENWIIWRDSGDWQRFATLWHDDGVMCATWRQSSAADFIRGCQDSWKAGVRVLHTLGGSCIDIHGERAVAQTRMTIVQRAMLQEVMVEATCQGRFYDLLEYRDSKWGIVLRQPIYERDRLDPLVLGTPILLDLALLQRFPEGYRHLAYLQTSLGFDVRSDMPGTRGQEVELLYQRGAQWLAERKTRHEL